MTCPACGAEAGDGARFCAECGRPIRAIDDQRRVVTVLFADLVGFTALSERLDPEQVKNLVDRCFDRLAADVTAFGGQVDKIVGDAIVALFGAPTAHEDDAERAVRAALRMQETLDAEAAEIGHELRIRVGVNTGEVLVGAMRAAGSVTAMGDVVNTASRLQTAAAPGEVLVGVATHAATSDAIAYESLGLRAAKGREEPVETWRALAPTLPPGYRVRRNDVPIVGRADELGMLRHAVGLSMTNERALQVLLVGDVGMGKSRIADEVACWAGTNHRALVREGRCVPYGEANVWWPVADALREGLGVAEDDDRATADQAVRSAVADALGSRTADPEVGRVTDGLLTMLGFEPAVPVDPATAREDAGRALVVYARALGERRPLVLQLSDLHWADDAVLALLDDVLGQLQHCPIVILATARPSVLDRWAPAPGRHNTLVLHLDPLGREATAELLGHLLDAPVGGEISEMLLDRSGGNPFFLEELVNLIDGEPPDTGSARVAALPSTLRGLVAARLDDLGAATRAVLQDASVIGQRGTVGGLREMAHKLERGIELDAAIAELVEQEILTVRGDLWEFESDLVREVAYQTITKGDRASTHLAIAAYLEANVAARVPRPVWLVDQLAHHYGQAVTLVAELGPVGRLSALPEDLGERARRWIEEAAERARRDQSVTTAARLYDQAIGLVDDERPEQAADAVRLHLARAELALDAWDPATARVHVGRATAIALLVGDRVGGAHALVIRGGVEQREGDIDAAVTTLTIAEGEFADLGDDAGRAVALRQRGMVEIFAGRTVEAEESALAALAAFTSVGDRSGQGWALQNLAWIAFVTGRADEADERLQGAIAHFSDLVDTKGMAWSLGLLSWVRFQQHRVSDASALAEQVLEEASSRSDHWAKGMMLLLVASIRLWTGRSAEAVDLASQARVLFGRLGDGYGTGQALSVLGRATVMVGHVEEGFQLLRATGDPVADRMTGMARLASAVQIGEFERAADILEVLEGERIGGPDLDTMSGMAALQRGDIDRARLALGSGVEDLPNDPNLVASRAMLAAVVGSGDAAILADRVAGIEGSTYLDQTMAQVAAALEAACAPDGATAAHARLAVASDLVGATDDVTAVGFVALAAASIAHRLGEPEAMEAERSARDHLDGLGLASHGWAQVFAQAVGVVPTPTA